MISFSVAQHRRISSLFLWLSFLLTFTTLHSHSFAEEHSPLADPRAVVLSGNARFTLLTPQLIRMEWSADGRFEDHASLVFINRKLPVPEFTSRAEGDRLVIDTGKLRLSYRRESGSFTADNLEVKLTVNGKDVIWHPGTEDKGNLRGTTRTLDGVRGSTPLEPGLLSRDGWVVVDDSERPTFDESDWPWVMPRPVGERKDLYFFGYGHDFKTALYDFTRIAGKIPMPPRFALGFWWSRYWAYTDTEFKELVREFENHNVPLDVLVIDMDWHQTFDLRWDRAEKDQAGEPLGWTGYTWNPAYFPDPHAFLSWCKSKGLKTPLNLHPASGVQPFERHYPEMARAMGIDPAAKKYVPFDIVDKKFATNFLNTVLQPLEKEGVDFWWLDWQQWSKTKIPGVTPTWWLNYVFFTDMERRGMARPIIVHRWGGLGNHRYEIGFSGDAISVWESLAFQPYFTATASNVGFGYWSHDIGGHMPGAVSPELYTRWIQFGAFSPILRTHTTKNPEAERRIWAYPVDYFKVMRSAIILRYSLIPYIYTQSRRAYESGVSILRPMYYDWPDAPETYDFTGQYLFGDEMLVAPVTSPVDTMSALVTKKVWLPPGSWFEWATGTRLRGPGVVERSYAIDEIPVFVKAGAIIPMQDEKKCGRDTSALVLTVFPGDSGATRVYEDEGNSLGYEKGDFTWTTVTFRKSGDNHIALEISPVEGSFPGMQKQRPYEIRFIGEWPPERVTCNGEVIAYSPDHRTPGWWYDGDRLTTIISLAEYTLNEKLILSVDLKQNTALAEKLLDGLTGKLARLRYAMTLIDNKSWPKDWSPDLLVKAVQTGNRIGLNPAAARDEAGWLDASLGTILNGLRQTKMPPEVLVKVSAHLKDVLRQ